MRAVGKLWNEGMRKHTVREYGKVINSWSWWIYRMTTKRVCTCVPVCVTSFVRMWYITDCGIFAD